METRVNGAMNQLLLQEFTKEEIKVALFQMNPTGAPIPDKFSALFYQNNWSTLGKEVSQFALAVLNHDYPLEHVNNTFLTLIPKIKKIK